MDGLHACSAQGSSFHKAPFITLDDLLWFLYLYPLRLLAALASQPIIYRLGTLFQFRANQRTELVARRMLAAPGAGIARDAAPGMARRLLANSRCRMLDDLLLSWPSRTRKLRCAGIEGFEHLERAIASGNGAIVITAHFCANHVAKRYLVSLGYPMLTVRDRIAGGDWWGLVGRRFLASRRRQFLHAITGESIYVQDRAVALKILQRLRSGGLVFMLFDGRSGKKSAVWPFLGLPRDFPTGVFEIIRLSRCAVIPMLCSGRSSAFRIKFGPPLGTVAASGREEFVRANLPNFVLVLEKQIQEYPEEWEEWISF